MELTVDTVAMMFDERAEHWTKSKSEIANPTICLGVDALKLVFRNSVAG